MIAIIATSISILKVTSKDEHVIANLVRGKVALTETADLDCLGIYQRDIDIALRNEVEVPWRRLINSCTVRASGIGKVIVDGMCDSAKAAERGFFTGRLWV